MDPGPAALNICFHGIGRPARKLDDGEASYWITPDTFHRVLDRLAATPEVLISFDDSNLSDIEVGLPALQERALKATFFVLAGRLGEPGSLSSADLRELVGQSMSVGSHGMLHRPWRRMDADAARVELVDARLAIEDAVGRPVRQAACPFGEYDRTALRQLRDAGFEHVHTSDRRLARPGAWIQPRFSVMAMDTPEGFMADVVASRTPVHRARRALVCTVKRWR
jgi:peptidoglycan/xylan/chitin deacetylase (PgdA/CDA1 family)